jgi:alkylation response protein AidB-like acyl-CoA dehydrogenase
MAHTEPHSYVRGTSDSPLSDLTIAALLAETAARFPDEPAVVFRDRADQAHAPQGRGSLHRREGTEMAVEVIQTLSGNGYVNEYLTGRLWRDAKLYEIGAGTSEIRRMLIGRDVQP